MTKWMDQLLRGTLEERTGGTPPMPCLDAETAAALADDTLSAAERSRAEAHAADCARCQALLATLVAITPGAVGRAWWRRPAVAWLVPAAVAATAILVWVNLPRSPGAELAFHTARDAGHQVESDESRIAPPDPDAARRSQSAPESPAPPTATRGRQEQLRDRSAAANDAPAAAQVAGQASRPVTSAAVAPQPPAADMRQADAVLPSTTSPHAGTAPQAAPSLAADAGTSTRAEAAQEQSIAETLTLTTSERTLARRFDAARETVIVSSNPISRWRIGSAGVVHHSTDGGATWQTHSTGVNVTLTGGASPSPAVCWLVGQHGTVLISTDEGRSWQRVPFPVAIDLVSIRATDDKTASVMTADGRTFSTSDRGRTWR
jgi:hypothetical protein